LYLEIVAEQYDRQEIERSQWEVPISSQNNTVEKKKKFKKRIQQTSGF